MAGKFKPDPKFTTPKGQFVFPKLNEPDYGNEKFPTPQGVYKVKVVFNRDDADVQELIEQLAPLLDAAVTEGKAKFAELKVAARKDLEKKNGKDGITINDFFKTIYDEETEEETGEIEMNFKMAASGVSKKTGKTWTRSPGVFDGHGERFPKHIDIWSGTTGKVRFSVRPYFVASSGAVGISLRLEAAQVIDLVSAGMQSAAAYGFSDEGGFSAADAPPPAETAESDAPSPAAGEQDDGADGDF